MSLTTIREYAEKYGETRDSIYQKYKRGYFKSAKKYGNQILLDDNEPLTIFRLRRAETLDNNPNVRKVRESRKKRVDDNGADNAV